MRALHHWLDERVDLASLRAALLDRAVPGDLTWWHTLGSATLAVFLVQVASGLALATSYAPSPDHAYDSIQYLQREVAGGAFVRGLHHWGASAMVALVCAHMVRVFTMGAYKYPREINWLLGVGLFLLVLGFGFTGYLLPWDQKAYWATQVGTSIAGTTPVIGEAVARVLRGGAQLGAATLTRFYALHTMILPLLLGALVALHLALVVRQGIAARPATFDLGAPSRTSDPEYGPFYHAMYAQSKRSGVRFWPDIVAKDVVVALGAVALLALLAAKLGAPLEAPADPTDAAYVPRPEWYFLPFYQLLKLVPGELESTVAMGVPGALVLALLALPLVDRRSARAFSRRPVARVALSGALGGAALLLGAAMREAPPTSPAEVGRPLSSAERAGRALFHQQHCGECHAVAGQGGSEDADAPELTAVGLRHSTAWLHSFLEDPTRFHPDSKMPAFGPPTLSHQEIEELARYLSSLRGPDGATRQPEFRDTFPVIPTPKEAAR